MFSDIARYGSGDGLVGGVWEVDKVAIAGGVVSGMEYGKGGGMVFFSRQPCLLK